MISSISVRPAGLQFWRFIRALVSGCDHCPHDACTGGRRTSGEVGSIDTGLPEAGAEPGHDLGVRPPAGVRGAGRPHAEQSGSGTPANLERRDSTARAGSARLAGPPASTGRSPSQPIRRCAPPGRALRHSSYHLPIKPLGRQMDWPVAGHKRHPGPYPMQPEVASPPPRRPDQQPDRNFLPVVVAYQQLCSISSRLLGSPKGRRLRAQSEQLTTTTR